MEFFIKAMNTRRVSTKFERLGASALDATPAFESVLALIFRIEEAIFDSQGRRLGGSWKRDTDEWLQRKLRNNLDPRINHATLALRRAFTEPGAEGQIVEMTPQSLKLSSDLPQAVPSQRERPFVQFGPNDRLRMRQIVRHHLVAAWSV